MGKNTISDGEIAQAARLVMEQEAEIKRTMKPLREEAKRRKERLAELIHDADSGQMMLDRETGEVK